MGGPQAHPFVLHEVGDGEGGGAAYAAHAVDHGASATVGVVLDLVRDPVEVDVDDGVWHVVQKELDRFYAGYVLLGKFLGTVH